MIRRATGTLAVCGTILGIGLIVLALLATSEAGVLVFVAGIWILISGLLFAGGYALMGYFDGR